MTTDSVDPNQSDERRFYDPRDVEIVLKGELGERHRRGRGAVGGKAPHKRTGSKMEEAAGETIPIGGAGLIVAYKHADAETVEPAVTRAVKNVVGEAEGRQLEALKGALADAQKEVAEESS